MKVIIEKDSNGLLWFKLNKPNKRNAIDFDVMFELEKALFMAKHDHSIKGMVIASEQKGMFCSGGDLDIFHGLVTEAEAFEMLSHMGKLLVELMFIPVPTIAFIDGAAVGGGCEISLACDFRIGTEQATFRFAQGKLGIITGWGGTTFASEKLQAQNALFMMLSGKKMDAEQALSTSMLHVKGEYEELTSWIHTMTALSPAVIRAYKETILCKYKREEIERRVLDECRRCAKLWEDEEHHQAVRNFLQK
ncbi:MAG: enoyl-CoA hydratase/isomerase family protein [Bacillaceae bacterium]